MTMTIDPPPISSAYKHRARAGRVIPAERRIMMLKDVTSSAAALYDWGWRAEDRDRLIAEYNFTEDEADILCAELEDMEPEIRTLRVQAGMTQREFSEYLNIPLRTIQEWEQGRRTPPVYVVELIKYKIEKEKLC
jgi:DNA-binding transcriptional regulator YiaG